MVERCTIMLCKGWLKGVQSCCVKDGYVIWVTVTKIKNCKALCS